MQLFAPAFRQLFPILLSLPFLFFSCSTEVDINAEPRDIWSVYGVLNPRSATQDLRISAGFLPEGNAEEAAGRDDLSVKGLRVVLRQGSREWVATEIDSVAKDSGLFFPFTTIYRFQTAGAQALTPGLRCDLEVTKADQPEFRLTAYTFVPQDLTFSSPTITPGPGGQRCLRQVSLDEEFRVSFNTGNALGFEVRAFLDYQENGVAKVADYGPTPMFTSGVRCRSEGTSMCYQFRAKEIIQAFFQDMDPNPNFVYTYGVTEATRCNDIPANLPDDFRFEVTAIDTALALYRQANNPAFTDLNTVRPEFTNIRGEGDAIVIGLFGSINTANASGQFNACTAYLLQLNNTPRPASPCEL